MYIEVGFRESICKRRRYVCAPKHSDQICCGLGRHYQYLHFASALLYNNGWTWFMSLYYDMIYSPHLLPAHPSYSQNPYSSRRHHFFLTALCLLKDSKGSFLKSPFPLNFDLSNFPREQNFDLYPRIIILNLLLLFFLLPFFLSFLFLSFLVFPVTFIYLFFSCFSVYVFLFIFFCLSFSVYLFLFIFFLYFFLFFYISFYLSLNLS